MTLLELRKAFIEATGRYDLVVNTTLFADNGADALINEGQRFLDLRAPSRGDTVTDVTIPTNSNQVTVAGVRSVMSAYLLIPGTEAVVPITLIGELTTFVNGYQHVTQRSAYEAATMMNMIHSDSGAYQSVTFTLQAKQPAGTKLRLHYVPFSVPLSGDSGTSWWSVNMPYTLLQAAMYVLERQYRNQEGMRDHLAAIDNDLRDLDHTNVERSSAQAMVMRNSF